MPAPGKPESLNGSCANATRLAISLLKGVERPEWAPRGSAAAQKHELHNLAASFLPYLPLHMAGRRAAVQNSGEMGLIWPGVVLMAVYIRGEQVTHSIPACCR